MNTVRKHLSAIKGGRLAAAAWPARLVSLADLRRARRRPERSSPPARPSPTRPPSPTPAPSSPATASRRRPPSPRASPQAADETPKPGDERLGRAAHASIIASPLAEPRSRRGGRPRRRRRRRSSSATPSRARRARSAAPWPASRSRCAATRSRLAPPAVLLSGGETTVTVRGKGKGGRNAEFLAGLALALDGAPGIFALAGDTDGIDGSEDNAGAIVDARHARPRPPAPASTRRAASPPTTAWSFFAALGDLVVTGPTLTNVNDFRAVLVDLVRHAAEHGELGDGEEEAAGGERLLQAGVHSRASVGVISLASSSAMPARSMQVVEPGAVAAALVDVDDRLDDDVAEAGLAEERRQPPARPGIDLAALRMVQDAAGERHRRRDGRSSSPSPSRRTSRARRAASPASSRRSRRRARRHGAAPSGDNAASKAAGPKGSLRPSATRQSTMCAEPGGACRGTRMVKQRPRRIDREDPPARRHPRRHLQADRCRCRRRHRRRSRPAAGRGGRAPGGAPRSRSARSPAAPAGAPRRPRPAGSDISDQRSPTVFSPDRRSCSCPRRPLLPQSGAMQSGRRQRPLPCARRKG